jgi:hypothetical protein
MLPIMVYFKLRRKSRKHGIHLWIPMILVYPFVFLLFVLLLPLLFVADLILAGAGWGRFPLLRALWGMGMVFGSLRGFRVKAVDCQSYIHIQVI